MANDLLGRIEEWRRKLLDLTSRNHDKPPGTGKSPTITNVIAERLGWATPINIKVSDSHCFVPSGPVMMPPSIPGGC